MRATNIILDVLGCENGPECIIHAALRAYDEFKVQITFVGDELQIRREINRKKFVPH